jgi:diguanylate cyclase (GGDEF)-like protein/PAS domain S-box-containing protein
MYHEGREPLVLVADDDSEIRRLAEESLRDRGFAVKTVRNGEQAVSEFRRLNPNLVLLDAEMPVMDGLEACAEIRESLGGKQAPVIMFIARDDAKSIVNAYSAGATDFQTKPVDWFILSQRIRYLLRSKEALEAMLQSEEKNKALLAAIPDLILTIDRNGKFIDCKHSNGFDSITLPGDFLNKTVGEVFSGEAAKKYLFHVNKALETKEIQVFEYPIDFEGTLREFETRAVPKGDDHVLTIVRDITEQKESARALEREKDFVATILDTTSALVVVRDTLGRIVRFNRACERATGYASYEVEKRFLWDFLLKPKDVVLEKVQFQEILMGKPAGKYEAPLLTKSNGERMIVWTNSTLHGRDNSIEYVISTGIDITERQQAEERIQFLAYYDGLTNLPNRILFKEHLMQALAYSQRHERLMAVMFIDVDRFKQINDTFGHSLGDLLLKGIAGRLKACLRRSDCVARLKLEETEASIGRFGGDEFTILIPDIPNVQAVAKIARRILESISEQFDLDGQEIIVTSSIGISIYPHDGRSAESLLKHADLAMYAAKDKGRSGYHFYNDSMNKKTYDRLTLENNLRKAIKRDEFSIYYQPKIEIKTRRLVGAEALLRWNHPTKGLITPSQFIPVAEETGLIKPMGLWGFHAVCKQSVQWQKDGFSPIPISVNLSAIQFQQRDLTDKIIRILSETKIDPQLIEMEITESTLMQNEEDAGRILMRLKDLGISISIDDFGTGYSSLYYIKRFTLDTLKIDRSFIKDLNVDPDDRAITRAIIALAKTLGLKVIAEGVEEKAHLEVLRDMGCDQAQGFYFSPPLPAEAFIDYVSKNNETVPAQITVPA